jgi:hypothetical protein
MHCDGSAKFLLHLGDSMDLATQEGKSGGDRKGKKPIIGARKQSDARLNGSSQQRWEPPPTGWVKLNTDASFCKETGETRLGIIVRDSEGKAMCAAWRELRGCGSPEQAEAEAYLERLRLTVEWVRQPTLVEADYQNLINDIQKSTNT